MPSFLRTIRLDTSDSQIFEAAAGPGEWAVPGGFEFCEMEPSEIRGKTRQAFANGFLSLETFGRSTLVMVAEIAENELEALVQALAMHFVGVYGAPDMASALPVARGEVDFAVELAQGQPLNTLLSVSRAHDDAGGIREEFRVMPSPTSVQHALVWDVVEDGNG
ncbi:DUF6505 family protein [Breoghania sp.]|uniref:DUF6505 family protein n=1 Tax=Breoghania sp. TaxID=2065378 RepID=UPI002AA6E718|nr:DUF6505 family protein [Breoghania sp.]